MANYIFVNPTATTNGSGGNELDPRNIWPTSISANDTILLRAGTTLLATSQLSLGSGSDVYVSRYGPDSDPDPILTVQSSNFANFNINRPGKHTFDHIHFKSFRGTVANGGGLMADQVSGGPAAELVIQHCRFSDMQWNAIRLHGTGANAAPTFKCTHSVFEDIGEDGIYGPAIDYEVTDSEFRRIGALTATGDPIGYIDGTPTRVYIARNIMDKSVGADTKQCVIIDTLSPTGLAILEDNTFIGYGSQDVQAIVHTVLIIECPSIVRRNRIVTAGLAYGFVGANCEFSSNVVEILNARTTAPVVALTGDNGRVYNNAFVSMKKLEPAQRVLTQGLSNTGNVVHNNIFQNVPIAIASDNASANLTATHNLFWNVRQQRRDEAGLSFSGGNDVTADPMFVDSENPIRGLKAGTPCEDAGKYIAGLRDINGNRFRRQHIGPWAHLRFDKRAPV